MIKEKMVRAMLEPLVSKAIKDIKSDPERGLRNTVDLALNFPTGRFSKKLFQITQKMLSNENSAYYNLINKISADVNEENLKDFSMNIGYNSCTFGAKKLREKESEMGFAIPWSISLYSSELPNWSEYVDKIIDQGNDFGIYLYPIFGSMAFDLKMIDIYKKHNDCAFVLLVDADDVCSADLNNIDNINNILISISGDDNSSVLKASDKLRKYGRLYSYHLYYSEKNAEKILEDGFLKSLEQYTNSFVFYIPDIDCDINIADIIKTNVIQIRNEQHYAFVLMDLRNDLYIIDGIISGGAYSIGFKSDGTVLTRVGIVDDKRCDIKTNPLSDVLKTLNKLKLNEIEKNQV
ncbi:MAG: hypothetical protein KH033_06200 [Clostridiales bacterium]|nr:hypothetical protein [Clostridiales bacterium]